MNFDNPLIPGVLIKRYKRFFVDIKVENKLITAHCPNTGSMMGLLNKNNKVWLSKSNNLKRKLNYTLQIIEIKGKKIGINTHLTNKIVLESLRNNYLKEFSKKSIIRSEFKYGENTRFDFFIKDGKKKSLLKLKM